jgi:hypothetical protein
MTFKSATWYPIAVVLSLLNLAGAGFAVGQAQPSHAAIHAGLALAFGVWVRRLRQSPDRSEVQGGLEALDAIASLEADVSKLRQEVSETQERLDFAERLLAQGSEARRVGAQRQGPK